MTHGHHDHYDGCNHVHVEDRSHTSAETERIVYKPNKGSDFFVVAQKGMVQKYRDDPSHVSLRNVVMTFQVYHKDGNNHGEPSAASNAEMTTNFGTDDLNDVIATILKNGHVAGHCC